jgi:DNA-binding response OmpR family regulator
MFEEDDAREIMDAGAFAYFAKPFNLEEIEAAVDRAIVRRQELSPEDAAQHEITVEEA